MKIAVITDDNLKDELLSHGVKDETEIEWNRDIRTLSNHAEVYIDLLFDTNREERTNILCQLSADVIIVNDVPGTAENLPPNFIRMNGWHTFLKRSLAEASCNNEEIKQYAEKALSFFNRKIEWVPDINGFITPRVVCALINEAFFSLQDNVSSREEIDTAVKLGTNYPYGPFEWSRLIGIQKVYSLLSILSSDNERYTPCDLLKIETLY